MIVFEDVSYSYSSGRYAIEHIDLSIGKGEMVAILGENGAGKTTLIKHMNGLLKPQRGTVIISGMNTKETTVASLARHVGLVFQNPDHQLFAETVEKELMFALINFNFPEEEISRRVEWALKEFGLLEYKDRSPFLLSGGERKRLALASVLCYDPSIVILDEPTTGQDQRQKLHLVSLLKKLNSEGKTVVVVTHDIEFAADFIPRSIIMSKGRIIADGDSEEILTNRELLMSASLLPPQLVELSWDLALNPPTIHFDEVVSAVRKLLEERSA
ncbi:MAG: energy-coupling factor ABC transporter ATP-binding protein [Candidatus Methanomethylicaceae archaeon]